MGEDQADVMACPSKHGVERIADGTLEGRARQAAVHLHVADGWLDGRPSAQGPSERAGHAAALAGDVDGGAGGGLDAVTADARSPSPSRWYRRSRRACCACRSCRHADRPRWSASAATRHPPLRCGPASRSAKTDRSGGDAERTPRHRSAASRGSPTIARRLPRRRARRRAEGRAAPPPAAARSRAGPYATERTPPIRPRRNPSRSAPRAAPARGACRSDQ